MKVLSEFFVTEVIRTKGTTHCLKLASRLTHSFLLIFIQPVGESQQVSAVGGSDVPEDPGEDPGESDEQPGNLD